MGVNFIEKAFFSGDKRRLSFYSYLFSASCVMAEMLGQAEARRRGINLGRKLDCSAFASFYFYESSIGLFWTI